MLIYLCALDSEEDKSRFQIIYEENYLRMYHVAFGILSARQRQKMPSMRHFLELQKILKNIPGFPVVK